MPLLLQFFYFSAGNDVPMDERSLLVTFFAVAVSNKLSQVNVVYFLFY